MRLLALLLLFWSSQAHAASTSCPLGQFVNAVGISPPQACSPVNQFGGSKFVTKTTSYTVQTSDNTFSFNNTGASTPITFTLPEVGANTNLIYCFYNTNGQGITVQPQADNSISIGPNIGANNVSLSSTFQNSGICLNTSASTKWTAYQAVTGAWTLGGTPVQGSTPLNASLNLSDVGSVATARTNLGLGTASNVTFGTVTVGSDQFSGAFGATNGFFQGFAQNVLLGELVNNAPVNSNILPVATAGACKVTTNGNQCFGLYGRGEARQPGTGGVVIGGEVTASNNTTNNPDLALPPNSAFGTTTTVPNGWQVTCGSSNGQTKDCSIGVYITSETGSYSQPAFNTAEYIGLFRQYGIYVDAMSSGNQTSAVLKNNGSGVNLQFNTTGAMVAANSLITAFDSGNVLRYNIKQNGDSYINTLQYIGHTATPTLGACGTSPTLAAFSTDSKGSVNVGTGTTSCVVNFGTTFTQVPVIVISGENVTSLNVQAKSASSFTVGGAGLASTTFDYIVMSNGSL